MARERDIEDILEDKASTLRDRVEENVDKFRERIDDVRDRFEETADKVKERSEEAWKDGVKYVQKHPAQAIGVAMVVGAALGVLLFGSKRND